jgi:hypothetical protein
LSDEIRHVVIIVTTILSLTEVIGLYSLLHMLSGIYLSRSVGTLKKTTDKAKGETP